MPRPEAALLDATRYPFLHAITTRFADVDPNRHLNNVALAAMMEDGRVRINQAIGMVEAIAPRRPMVASMAIEYLAQGFFPDPVEVRGAIEAVGRSSLTIIQLLTQNSRPVAFARSIVVCTENGAASPLPEEFRVKLLASWTLRP